MNKNLDVSSIFVENLLSLCISKLCGLSLKNSQRPQTAIMGENIIATTKIRNNYGAIQSFSLHPFWY
jgi:hypothetical protein